MTNKREKADMSPEAIAGRLEIVRALYKLCSSLKQAGRAAGLHPALTSERDRGIRSRDDDKR